MKEMSLGKQAYETLEMGLHESLIDNCWPLHFSDLYKEVIPS